MPSSAYSPKKRLTRGSFLKIAGSTAAGWIASGCQGTAKSRIEQESAISPSPSTLLPSPSASPPNLTSQTAPTGTATRRPTETPSPNPSPTATTTVTPSPLPTASPTPTVTPVNPERSVAIRQVESYDLPRLRQEMQAALDSLGGLADLVKPGASVAIKPNLTGGTWAAPLVDRPATESYVTHPAVVQVIGELLRDAGAGNIYIVEVDLFVSVPKLKCHWTCGITLAMKNLVGITPLDYYRVKPEDTYRSSLHGLDSAGKSRIPKVVIDLLQARPIQLAVIDGILTVDGGEGPWQKTSPQEAHVLLAGRNPLATDSVATAVMGFDPTAETPQSPFFQTYNYLNLAMRAGLGTNRLEDITIVGTPLEAVRCDFKSGV